MRKKIIVACGSGVATSNTVAEKIKELCIGRKLSVEVQPVDFRSLKDYLKGADCFVTITPYDNTDYGIPVINGIPFLTGVGLNEEMDKLEKIIKK
jgi:galactitol PTS system EIIB component